MSVLEDRKVKNYYSYNDFRTNLESIEKHAVIRMNIVPLQFSWCMEVQKSSTNE